LLQFNLSEVAKHWDSFLTHCRLRANIEDIEHLRDVLTKAGTSGMPTITHKVISIDKSSEILDHKDTLQHTDVNGRRALYPLLAKFQLVLATKPVPNPRSGLSRPFAPALKRPSAKVLEG
jgi:hypothetical protein